jgi:uncharacterized protein (TIGR03437 family)
MRFLSFVLAGLVFVSGAAGQSYIVTSVAGGAIPDNVQATSADLVRADGVAVDPSGNVFVLSQYVPVIWRVNPSGLLERVAGTGLFGYNGDNIPARDAQLVAPLGIAVDSAGSLYIADTYVCRIRKVTGGTITTVAGSGVCGYSGDNGPALQAQLSYPQSVAVDSAGNLYIADTNNNRVRKVSNGTITTVAGTGAAGNNGYDGAATSIQLNQPVAVAVDSSGRLYIADMNNNVIRMVSGGTASRVAGGNARAYYGDNGPATSAALNNPQGIAIDAAGTLYIADTGNQVVRKVTGGTISKVAGAPSFGGYGGDGGAPTSAILYFPRSVAVDAAGNLYIGDSDNGRVRKVANNVITTVAGGGTPTGENGPALSGQLGNPFGTALGPGGELYIADTFNHRVRKLSTDGVLSTVAGAGTAGYSGDGGPGTAAQLNMPYGVTVDADGSVYIADYGNQRIRRLSNGTITTFAGGGQTFNEGGAATGALIPSPVSVAIYGNDLYITDVNEARIRKVSLASGIITTVVGNGGHGHAGDGGPATQAWMLAPIGIAFNPAGDLYIADFGDGSVRKVSGGTITTFVAPFTIGGAWGIAADSEGDVFVSASSMSAIYKVTGGDVTPIAGGFGTLQDNVPGFQAGFLQPTGLTTGPGGVVYVADTGNSRIRLLTPAAAPVLTSGVDAAGLGPFLSPGALVLFRGNNLAGGEAAGNAASPAPQLGGASITANWSGQSRALPLLYVSPGLIYGQIPLDVPAGATVQFTPTSQGIAGTGITVQLAAAGPGLFTLDAQTGIVMQNGRPVTAAEPAVTGQPFTVFGTGFGGLQPGTSDCVFVPTVTVAGAAATVTSAGMVAGLPGLYQVTATLPAGTPSGAQNLIVRVNGVQSNTVQVSIR